MLFDQLVVGKRIPYHKKWKENKEKAEFYEESVEVSNNYWNVPDANGNAALKRFTCESLADYKWRKQTTTPKNYNGSILNKYISTSFKEQPIREENDFYSNVDLLGSTMDDFIKYAVKKALIEGVSYILPDSTAADTSISEAQKRILGIRPFLRFIDSDEAINWVDYLGHLQEIIIELEDANDECYYLYYDNTNYARIDVDSNDNIVAISELVQHGYEEIPVVRILPFDTEESFVASGANMQLSINNLSSLEKVEIYKATFTRYFASGFPVDVDSDGQPVPIDWGTGRVIHTPAPEGKFQVIGADVSQADSIRKSIAEETSSLFQQYHLTATQILDATQTPSGYALIVSRADFNSICSQIVKSAEAAELKIINLLNDVESLGLSFVPYPKNFIEPNEAEDILKLRDLLALDLPEEAKTIAKERFIKKYLSK
jgi:hypothetical protein